MLLSMTGFGKAVAEDATKKITVEIRSLNSKQLDLSLRLPNLYKEREMEIRTQVSRALERGKVELFVHIEQAKKGSVSQINLDNFAAYHRQVKEIASQLKIEEPTDWFSLLIRLPEVLATESPQAVEDTEWDLLMSAVGQAIDELQAFRKQEGRMLQELFLQKIEQINRLLTEIEPYENERVERIYQRMHEALQRLQEIDFDKNRLEQEMIYHIERLDVNEEKVRLKNHLNYFIETLEQPAASQGKKLGFILQEVGREINTLGSKSNHSEMQKIVVQMKDELEQMKEQVLNVL